MAQVMEMLALSPTMEEGTLAEWLKNEGDTIEEGEILAEVETDKATMEMESFFSGTILKLLAEPGQTVRVGEPLAIIGEEGEEISDLFGGGGDGKADASGDDGVAEQTGELGKEESSEPSRESGSEEASEGDERRLKVSPLARRIAEERGINLALVDGSGPGGRIIKRDVEALEAEEAAGRALQAAGVARPEDKLVGADTSLVPGESKPLSQMRKAIARRLVDVWQTTPHFYLTKEIDMAAAMKLRTELNAELAAVEGPKISVNDMIVKASAAALAQHPAVNAAFGGESLYQFGEVNVGVAVAIEEGLITPTVREADKKSLTTIAREIRELAGRAREKKLKPEEYGAHTFSVSNLGMFEIDDFLAVINPPDAAILACGSVQKVPVVDGEDIVIGTRMKVSLSCDHRVIDGATGAKFLQTLQQYLERPMLLLA